MSVPRFAAAAMLLLFSAAIYAQTPILPLKQIHAGMHGVGRTVFTGSQISDFDVEILGVLENIGPKESLILSPALRRPAGTHRRHAGDERQPRIHRRQTDWSGGHGVSVLQRPHRGHSSH